MSYFDPQRCPHGIRWHVECSACLADAERIESLAEFKRRAHDLLDHARNGEPVAIRDINTALELTGDMEHVPFSLADALGVAA